MEQIANCPTYHDHFFYGGMNDLRAIRDFLDRFWKYSASVKVETIEIHPTKFITDEFRRLESDLLFSFELETGYRVYVLLEHQSTAKKQIPFRTLKYRVQIMERYYLEGDSRPYPLVFQFVLYNGKRKYNKLKNLGEIIHADMDLIQDSWGELQPFELIDVNEIEDDFLQKPTWLNIILLYMKHIYDEDFEKTIEETMPHLISVLELTDDAVAETRLTLLINYISHSTNSIDRNRVVGIFCCYLKAKQSEVVMTLVEQWQEEGRLEGRVEGRVEGQLQERANLIRRLVRNFAAKGVSVEDIAVASELDLADVEGLLEDQH